ncbi:hypothetical protein QAO71_17315 (plasmid) [Halopseudomonas sp. SMJS2]|uniref:hypothetical protein n=1 Tax=Halopseudomonas sp. SMJS2 TaxID=3041098 RepID=UPI0024530F2C|nr:hypothetical protein [Halopseudomonas sp. SMJS2]WGK63528.1 hypothetical protein QAO71_17315 [Halopseudomonas sp. SMJS2]
MLTHPNRYFCGFCLATASFLTHAADSYVIDQRDERYQIAIEHISNASMALAAAKSELNKAQATYSFPGLDINRMTASLVPVEETLRVLLVPEQKRLKYQTAIPDGVFFLPTPVGD